MELGRRKNLITINKYQPGGLNPARVFKTIKPGEQFPGFFFNPKSVVYGYT
jgi:hypothetical protein